MHIERTRILRPRARRTAAALVVACLALTGCGTDDVADRLTKKAIESAAGEDAEVDIDTDSGEIKVESSDGSFTTGRTLPADFPEDDVPLVDGELIQAVSVEEDGSTGYAVHMRLEGTSPAAAVAEAVGLLEGAGFEVEEMPDIGVFETRTLTTADYRVMVSGLEVESDSTTLQYMVFPAETS